MMAAAALPAAKHQINAQRERKLEMKKITNSEPLNPTAAGADAPTAAGGAAAATDPSSAVTPPADVVTHVTADTASDARVTGPHAEAMRNPRIHIISTTSQYTDNCPNCGYESLECCHDSSGDLWDRCDVCGYRHEAVATESIITPDELLDARQSRLDDLHECDDDEGIELFNRLCAEYDAKEARQPAATRPR
jgi:hypothetical protein